MLGFDCNTKLSYGKSLQFRGAGYKFVVRYVGRYTMNKAIDIDKKEVDNITRAGLGLAIVQHCPGEPGIIPSAALGKEWGANALKFTKAEGVTPGTSLYLDLENVNKEYKNRQQDIIDYCNAWYYEVLQEYTPGIYIGYNVWLTGKQLYEDLKFQHYWKSLSIVPMVAVRGYEMIQSSGGTKFGIQIDTNHADKDLLGSSPVFMYSAAIVKLDKDLEILYNAGIINSVDYWRTKVGEVKYLDLFISNVSKHVQSKGGE